MPFIPLRGAGRLQKKSIFVVPLQKEGGEGRRARAGSQQRHNGAEGGERAVGRLAASQQKAPRAPSNAFVG